MISFNPSTQPVAMKEWQMPLDPSIYAQGIANQAKKTEEQSLLDSSRYNTVMNLTAMAPQDEEQLQKIQQAYQQELSGLTMGDLSTPQAKQQLAQIQDKYSNLILETGIPQRDASLRKEMALKKDAESKGEKFTSPLITQAENYIKDGYFHKDTRFNRSGWLTPNEAKSMKSAKDLVEKKKGWKENPNGTREEYEYYDPADLKVALQQVYKSDPNYEKELEFRFEQQTKDINWDDYSKQENSTLAQEAKNNVELAQSLYVSAKDNATKQKALELYNKASQIYNMYADAFDNPSSTEEVKYNAFNDFKNRQLQMAISAMDAEQRKPISMNEIKKAQMDLSNDLYKMRETELFKLETDSGLSRKNYASEADFIKDAAIAVQKNKVKTAEASNPSISTRSENYIDYIREGAIKDGAEKKEIESNISNNIDYFKNVGFTNIKGIESVKMDENGDFIVDFNREKFNPINTPIGVINNTIGDEVKLTKDEMARIMEVGTGKRKVEDLNNISSVAPTTAQNLGEIKLENGFVIPTDTVEAIRAQLLSLGKDASNASVEKIYKKKYK
jgi:hypothetical protein